VTRERLLTRPFLLCSAANLAQGLAFNLYLHLAGFLEERGADEVEVGLIGGVSALAGLLLRPTLARVLDRRGRRVVILVGSILNVFVCALYLTVSTLGPWIYLVRVGHGLAEAMLFTGLFTYAADFVPASRRNEGLALFGVSGMLPIGLGGLLGDLILARATYRALFLASVAFAGSTLLLASPLRDHEPVKGASRPSRGFLAAAVQRNLVPIWLLGLAFAITLTGAFTFLKLFVERSGIGSVGLFFSMYSGAAIILRVVAGWLPDRVGPKRVLFPSLLALAAGFVTLSVAGDDVTVAAAGLLCGIGHGYIFPILFGLVVTRARFFNDTATTEIYTGLFDAGWLIGGPALGHVASGGRFPQMFLTAAAVILVGGSLFALWELILGSSSPPRRDRVR
jgi:MFS family permease